jgi:hypothetical protein
MLASSGPRSLISSPYLILGECKSFGKFNEKDFARARKATEMFPGAVVCFCSFNESLTAEEIAGIKPIVEAGRKRLDVGKQLNPVLILTARELFGQFRPGEFSAHYDDDRSLDRRIWHREMNEVCEYTQRLYLGMPSSHEVRQKQYRKRAARKKSGTA